MTGAFVQVRGDGCIQLSRQVTCDGFSPNSQVRVQTHIHDDHLKDFERSKGAQKFIVMTPESHDILIAKHNADIGYRKRQIKRQIPNGRYHDYGFAKIALWPAGHMPGSAMVSVEDDGLLHCYTGDFAWPLRQVPEGIHTLVVDATYGNPANLRRYSWDDAIEELIELTRSRLSEGAVSLRGYYGRLQYALILIAEQLKVPIIGSPKVIKGWPVMKEVYGTSIDAIPMRSEEGRRVVQANERAIVGVETRERAMLLADSLPTKITLSAFMVPKQDAVIEWRPGNYGVAFTDHADFVGTIELIRAISPSRVIADASRGGDAQALVDYVRHEIGIDATRKVVAPGLKWGEH